MKTLKYRSQGEEVHLLDEMLVKLGYNVSVSNTFGKDTENAVKDFQLKNNLVVDGVVGLKTWSKLFEKDNQFLSSNNKFLSEQDLIDFALRNNLELAAVKAVNEVESRGKGFLVQGRPVILFEGHVFWSELKRRGFDPQFFLNDNTKDILYESWTRKYYLGGDREYTRLEKSASLSVAAGVKEAAYCSASWGAFQIMGNNYKTLGYPSVEQFVEDMNKHEREHLNAFGKFIETKSFSGKKLKNWLREKNWEKFANGYNGNGYKLNKYDTKLKTAYEKYLA